MGQITPKIKWANGAQESEVYTKKGKLSKKHIVLAETIPNWYWDIKDDAFHKMYNVTKKWVIKNERMTNTQSTNFSERKYASWCNALRKKRKQKKLSIKIIKKLEEIPYWYWVRDYSSKKYSGSKRYKS